MLCRVFAAFKLFYHFTQTRLSGHLWVRARVCVCAAVTEAALNEHAREREANTIGKTDVKSRGRLWDWCSSTSKRVQNPWHYRTGRPISRGWGVGGGIYQVCIKAIPMLEVSVGGRCSLMRIAVLKRSFVDLWLTDPVFVCRFSDSCVL